MEKRKKINGFWNGALIGLLIPATIAAAMAFAKPKETRDYFINGWNGLQNYVSVQAESEEKPEKLKELEQKVENPQKISQAGINLIKKYEGFRADSYKCPAGKDTIGYGHLIRDGENYTKITEQEGEELLRTDVDFAEKAVKRYVKVNLNQNQYDALVNFVYNLGEGNFSRSTLLKKLNASDYDGAGDEILRWNKANGKVLNGLVKRRTEERELFLKTKKFP